MHISWQGVWAPMTILEKEGGHAIIREVDCMSLQ